VLLLLAESRGHLLDKDTLLKRLWPDAVVEQVALPHAISQIRKALGWNSQLELIETVPKRGYRFVAPVEVVQVDTGRSAGG